MSDPAPITEERMRKLEQVVLLIDAFPTYDDARQARTDFLDLIAELRRMRDSLTIAAKQRCNNHMPKDCPEHYYDQFPSHWCLPCFARHILGDRTEETG